MPIEDTTPAITRSTKVLVRKTGTGASLGGELPEHAVKKSNNTHYYCKTLLPCHIRVWPETS